MASFMRAVDIRDGKGDADALFINDKTAKPTAGAGEAVVRIKAFGLNRMDLLQRQGLYPLPPQAPATMGVEFSGVVESLGAVDSADTASFAVGDEVFGLAYGGAYAEYVRVSTRMLLHKPTSLGWNEAAGLPETWLTALQALHEVGGFRSGNDGQTTLWHAGASGVSIAGIQLSRRAGAKAVYATAGSDAKCAFVVDQLGATAAFNYKTEDWVQKMVDATDGTGVDLIVDYVGADYFQKNLTVAARDAHIVLLAFLSGAVLPAGVNISPLLIKRVRIEGSSLRSRDLDYQSRLRDRLADVLPGFHSGDLRIFVDRVLPWTEIVDAHKYMEANMSMGKIICTIPW